MLEVFNENAVKKALLFAHEHPEIVCNLNSEEYNQVKDGYFSSFFSLVRSNSEELKQ